MRHALPGVVEVLFERLVGHGLDEQGWLLEVVAYYFLKMGEFIVISGEKRVVAMVQAGRLYELVKFTLVMIAGMLDHTQFEQNVLGTDKTSRLRYGSSDALNGVCELLRLEMPQFLRTFNIALLLFLLFLFLRL
jgi:hypothetical protein